jgi:periplasmic divalent cation tolerance protein
MIVIFTTYPSEKEAKDAAKMLVEKKLAACVSMVKIENSFYRWKGKVEQESEYLLLIKTKELFYPRVEIFIKANHPNKVPELFYLKIKGGDKNYLEWIKRNTLFF